MVSTGSGIACFPHWIGNATAWNKCPENTIMKHQGSSEMRRSTCWVRGKKTPLRFNFGYGHSSVGNGSFVRRLCENSAFEELGSQSSSRRPKTPAQHERAQARRNNRPVKNRKTTDFFNGISPNLPGSRNARPPRASSSDLGHQLGIMQTERSAS